MAARIRKKLFSETKSVYDAAIERIETIYDRADKVVVSFSGGKDSTAVLNLTLEVAKRRGKLPLEVVFFDEEAIHPPTIEYVQRVSERDDVDFKWFCLPVKHRNACSNEEPYWYCWEKGKEDIWVRPLPDQAITSHKNFRHGMTFQEFFPYLYERKDGVVFMLTGIRTEESLRRYQVIARKKNDHYMQMRSEKGRNQYRAFPVYDWSSDDVWLAVKKFGWDYNKTYDIFNQTSLNGKFLTQRVCPPYGEEPLRGLWIYAECFPEMWHKMISRVKGVATAWRYGNTHLYSNASVKPEGITYQQYLKVILDSYSKETVPAIAENVNKCIRLHKSKTVEKIPDYEYHPVSGISWRFICKIAIRGDLKGRTLNQATRNAIQVRKKLKITEEEANRKYGARKKR